MSNPILNSEVIIAAPGRINLIGEHLDYNGGFVMPAAIDLNIELSFKKNQTNTCNLLSQNLEASFSFSLENIVKSEVEWHNYILGVVHFILEKFPNSLSGFDCSIKSSLPIGSGVSSSAALECGIAKGLNTLFNIGLSEADMIHMSQAAEHHFVGTKCGIMDQFVVVRGKKNKIIHLNCSDLSYRYIDTDLGPYRLLLLNTNVSHNLATSAYNQRRAACESGLKAIQKIDPSQKVLANVPLTLIEKVKNNVTTSVYNKISYVVEENNRTHATVSALESKDWAAVGQLLYQSHEGLRHQYEVSCEQLDFLVDATKEWNQILGARMMGGGFGGCTLNLIQKDFIAEFTNLITPLYENKYQKKLTAFEVSIGDGVKII